MKKNIVYECVCCGAKIEKIEGFDHDKEWEGCYSDGIVEKISAGYGSTLDGEMFVLAICDKCVVQKANQGVLKFVGDYMFPEMTEETRKSYGQCN